MSGTVLCIGYIMVTKTDMLSDLVDPKSGGGDEHIKQILMLWGRFRLL